MRGRNGPQVMARFLPVFGLQRLKPIRATMTFTPKSTAIIPSAGVRLGMVRGCSGEFAMSLNHDIVVQN
jgi:hypothetical protein